jgi:hypothetical protein
MKKIISAATLGAGVGGALDIVYAIVLWGFILGGSPMQVLQSVAAGLLGKEAYDGGGGTAALGLALHFSIAFCMALAYVLASRKLPALNEQPWAMGALYGIVLFVVMNFIVVPLSAIGWRSMSAGGLMRGLLPHIVFVGPAIAWAAARAAKKDSPPIS